MREAPLGRSIPSHPLAVTVPILAWPPVGICRAVKLPQEETDPDLLPTFCVQPLVVLGRCGAGREDVISFSALLWTVSIKIRWRHRNKQ